jgi:hypothetical protein
MKHILPILTITTLAAAASAQSAVASSGLSYNRVDLSYQTNGTKGYSLGASALIGSSNFLVSASTTVGGGTSKNGTDSVSLGYVFKNVAFGADAIVSVGSNESYALDIRKDLGSNLEGSIGYARNSGVNSYSVGVAYNLTKQYQLGVEYSKASGVTSQTAVVLHYNF